MDALKGARPLEWVGAMAGLGVVGICALDWLGKVGKAKAQREHEKRLAEVEKRSIFVTGAASGIGLATAKLFLLKGWFVGLYDINEAGLNEVIASLEAQGADTASFCHGKLDVLSYGSCETAVAIFTSKAPKQRIDVLFNCAGLLVNGPFDGSALPKQLAQVGVNLNGLATLTHAALPFLKASARVGTAPLFGRTRVINMSSSSAMHGVAFQGIYSATKAAVRAITEAWVLEWEDADTGVACMDVSAPLVATPMVKDQKFIETPGMSDPSSWLAPEDVATAVWFAAHADPIHNIHCYTEGVEGTFKHVAFHRCFLGDASVHTFMKQYLVCQK